MDNKKQKHSQSRFQGAIRVTVDSTFRCSIYIQWRICDGFNILLALNQASFHCFWIELRQVFCNCHVSVKKREVLETSFTFTVSFTFAGSPLIKLLSASVTISKAVVKLLCFLQTRKGREELNQEHVLVCRFPMANCRLPSFKPHFWNPKATKVIYNY